MQIRLKIKVAYSSVQKFKPLILQRGTNSSNGTSKDVVFYGQVRSCHCRRDTGKQGGWGGGGGGKSPRQVGCGHKKMKAKIVFLYAEGWSVSDSNTHTHTYTHARTLFWLFSRRKILFLWCVKLYFRYGRLSWCGVSTRWLKYDRDYLCVNKLQFVPVIFEPPCTLFTIVLFGCFTLDLTVTDDKDLMRLGWE
jgi:hypothetical protein